jgi:hypothetical protein
VLSAFAHRLLESRDRHANKPGPVGIKIDQVGACIAIDIVGNQKFAIPIELGMSMRAVHPDVTAQDSRPSRTLEIRYGSSVKSEQRSFNLGCAPECAAVQTALD